MPKQPETFVDYTACYARTYGASPLAVHGRGRNVLVLVETDPSVKAKKHNGKAVTHELQHKFLSRDCVYEMDQAYACVSGDDMTYWNKSELKLVLKNIKAGTACLFDHFNLF